MGTRDFYVVTGAFGYLGKYITRILLDKGITVKTITGHPDRPNEFGGRVEAMPFNFDKPDKLVESLRGASVVINTYWVRFNRGKITYDLAVKNTRTLIKAAKEAGVKRFVHTSITSPSIDSPFPYFSGKAALENALKESGLSYGIIRPTVLFGKEDILVNNIAYILRRLPVFGIMGKGDYKVQPVYVADAAALAVELAGKTENLTVDAVGPETYTFREMTQLIRNAAESRAVLLNLPPVLVYLASKFLSLFVGDVLLTHDEVGGLMAGLLYSNDPPTCKTVFSQWLKENADNLGRQYASELKRHYK